MQNNPIEKSEKNQWKLDLLANEILFVIMRFLGRNGILALSSASKRLRGLLTAAFFAKIIREDIQSEGQIADPQAFVLANPLLRQFELKLGLHQEKLSWYQKLFSPPSELEKWLIQFNTVMAVIEHDYDQLLDRFLTQRRDFLPDFFFIRLGRQLINENKINKVVEKLGHPKLKEAIEDELNSHPFIFEFGRRKIISIFIKHAGTRFACLNVLLKHSKEMQVRFDFDRDSTLSCLFRNSIKSQIDIAKLKALLRIVALNNKEKPILLSDSREEKVLGFNFDLILVISQYYDIQTTKDLFDFIAENNTPSDQTFSAFFRSEYRKSGSYMLCYQEFLCANPSEYENLIREDLKYNHFEFLWFSQQVGSVRLDPSYKTVIGENYLHRALRANQFKAYFFDDHVNRGQHPDENFSPVSLSGINFRRGSIPSFNLIKAQVIEDLLKDPEIGNNCLNAGGNDKGTPLHYAAYLQCPEIVTILIEAGADVTCADTYNCLPIHYSAEKGDLASFELMFAKLQERANFKDLINQTSVSGKTVLDEAITSEKANLTIIELLLNTGSKCQYRNGNGRTSLHHVIINNRPEIVPLIIHLFDLTLEDYFSMTYLHHAALKSDLKSLKLILEKLKETKLYDVINKTDHKATTALQYAVAQKQCDPSSMILLLENGADPNVRHNDRFPLNTAIEQKNLAKVIALLKWGADPLAEIPALEDPNEGLITPLQQTQALLANTLIGAEDKIELGLIEFALSEAIAEREKTVPAQSTNATKNGKQEVESDSKKKHDEARKKWVEDLQNKYDATKPKTSKISQTTLIVNNNAMYQNGLGKNTEGKTQTGNKSSKEPSAAYHP